MSFIDDIKNCFCENELAPKTFRAVLFGNSAGYFEGVTAIQHYAENEIALCLKKGAIIVKGENLYLKKYCQGDVCVCGKIKSIEMA